MERKVIVIAGPTSAGKTKVGISLAGLLNSEIISADSRQIYKYLDIGTAKPTADELAKCKHHFIDLLEPDQNYNVSKFENDSLKIVNLLLDKGKIPIVAGGSGLYIRALVDGIFDSVDNDEEYREKLREQREKFGNLFIYEELRKIDPESASKMLPQNWKRVMRALEVFHLTGEPISEFQSRHKRELDIEFIQFGLKWKRDKLYSNIESRVDQMIETGLENEVKNILSGGFSKNLNALNTVGYKEIISYLEGEITIERAVELIKRNTRRFAKRQMTWFSADERIKWLQIDSQNDLEAAVGIVLKNIN